MKSRPTEQADAERAVMAYKHELAIHVMRHIVRLAQRQPYVFPGDIPQDIVAPEHRQGVVSNAWASLKALEIIAEVSPLFTDVAAGIYHGLKCNKNPGAKSRWVSVYRLASAARAQIWLLRNGGADSPMNPESSTQLELVAA